MNPSRLLTLFLLGAAPGLEAWADPVSPDMQPPAYAALKLAAMPETVTSFGAVVWEDALYVFGGHQGERHAYSIETVSGSLHRLALVDGASWERLPSAEPSQGAALVAHGRSLYRVGGMAARNAAGEKHDLHSKASVGRYDIRDGRWTEHTPMPAPRSSHDAAVIADTLYVGGGWQLGGASGKAEWHSTVLALDLARSDAAWKEIPQPFQRRALAMAVHGAKLYFLGGMNAENDTSVAVDILDTATGQWLRGPDLPSGPMNGFGCSAIAFQGRLYYSGRKGDLCRLSVDGSAWEIVARLDPPRFFHRLASDGVRHLVVAGGEGADGKLDSVLRLVTGDAPAPADVRDQALRSATHLAPRP